MKKFTDGTNTSSKKFHVTRGVGRAPAMPHSHHPEGAILKPVPAQHPLQHCGIQQKLAKTVLRKRGGI
jgi:hypothetical protein